MKVVVVLLLALVALGYSSKPENGCNCGTFGEACEKFGYFDEDDKIVEVGFLNVTGECVMDNVRSCEIDETKTFVTCECKQGYEGDLCEERIVPLIPNLIVVGLVFPIFLLAAGGFLLRKYHANKGRDDFQIPQSATTQGIASPRVLLLYRVIVLGFAYGVQINQFVKGGVYPAIRFFTVLNFLLLCLYFGIGVYLSFKAVFFPKQNPHEIGLTPLQKFFYVLMEVESCMTLLVCAVTWGVLLPSVSDKSVLVNFQSFIQHAANILFMFGDYALNGLDFKKYHVLYVGLWGALYIFYHNIIMLVEYLDGTGHRPSYFFLSSAEPTLIAWLIGLMVVLAIFYGIALGLSRCKPAHIVEDDLDEVKKESSLAIPTQGV